MRYRILFKLWHPRNYPASVKITFEMSMISYTACTAIARQEISEMEGDRDRVVVFATVIYQW